MFGSRLFVGCCRVCGVRHTSCHIAHHTRVCAPRHLRCDFCSVKLQCPIVGRAFVSGELLPLFNRSVKCFTFRCETFTRDVFISRIIGSNHTRTCPRLNRHIANGHPFLNAEGTDRRTRIFNDGTVATVNTDVSNDREDDVFCGYAVGECAINPNLKGFRFLLQETLRGEDMFDLACADAESECPECAMR